MYSQKIMRFWNELAGKEKPAFGAAGLDAAG
jgi:hypothetical protein